MATEFTPDYLNLDFTTLVDKFKDELRRSEVFRDYDFEGSNIAILLELMSYVGELNTFFMNKIAKNNYLETADVYEAANRLARQIGYEAKGTRSARGTLTVEVSGTSPGDILRVLAWKQLNSGRTDPDGNEILFCTTASVTVTASGDPTFIRVPVRQGTIRDITGYTGDDLIDNELILPVTYAYDDDLSDELPSVRVLVNDDEWTRLSDFYLNLIPVESDNVYMFIYDRYERNKVVFNSSRNVPGITDTIDVRVIDSLGTDGSVAADVDETWTIEDDEFIEITSGVTTSYVNNSLITPSLSAATIGAAAPETIAEIRANSASALRAQFRNATKSDYSSHLTSRSDVIAATAYGEQDLAPSGGGDPQEYNLVHLSTIPDVWGSSTINTSAGIFFTDWSASGATIVPLSYSSAWEDELLDYLKPRKIVSAYEIFEVPDLVYFSFEIGIRKKRVFDFADIKQDVLAKLIYYFRPENQDFNSEIDFNDVVEYLLDTTEVSPDDDYENIRGIRNLNIRDINSNKPIYAFSSDLYPRYNVAPWTNRDNKLRQIIIGFNQFPYLAADSVSIIEET